MLHEKSGYFEKQNWKVIVNAHLVYEINLHLLVLILLLLIYYKVDVVL